MDQDLHLEGPRKPPIKIAPLRLTPRDLMHPCPVKALPTSPGWLYELKYDGFRVLVSKVGQTVRLCSRNGRDMAGSFPELVADLQASGRDFTIDGELVVVDHHGHPQFERLRRRALRSRRISVKAASLMHPAAIFAFDLLEIDGLDERHRPLLERKRRLGLVLGGRKRVKLAGHHENGVALLAKAVKLELEGIVAKRADSTYTAGRSRQWLKIKTRAGIERERGRVAHLRR